MTESLLKPTIAADVKFHPLADLFPLMAEEEFKLLVADIKANGLRVPISEFEGAILDGRNRYLACIEADVPVQAIQYEGTDPRDFVLSVNLHRRHLNESQRALVACKLANIPHGGNRSAEQAANLPLASQADAATLLHISERLLRSAKKVQERGSVELVRRVESGELAVSVAAKIAALPPEEQAAMANLPEPALRGAVKKARRAKREASLGDATRAASAAIGTKLYGVIYADPPWRFEPYSRETGMDRAADNHYPTMAPEEIVAIQVPAADNCVLFLWATVPTLPQALAVVEAWGFTYKSHCIWLKDRQGTGYWFRNQHEMLLVAVRGDVPAPAPGENYSSVLAAGLAGHSAKPAAFAEMIEEMFPNVPAIEMFARASRPGWDVWGNET